MTRPMYQANAPLHVRLRDVAVSLASDSRVSIILEGADRIADLEGALRQIADGDVDAGGNRRAHHESMQIARSALAKR